MQIGRNQPKSLSGIETTLLFWDLLLLLRRNQPKSLSGIETVDKNSILKMTISPEST